MHIIHVDGRKQREVVEVPNPTHVVSRGGTWSWWGKETKYVDPRVYYIDSYSNVNNLREYPTSKYANPMYPSKPEPDDTAFYYKLTDHKVNIQLLFQHYSPKSQKIISHG